MKRLDIIIPHERVGEVNEVLHKHNVGGMTFYDIKGRGRSKNEPIYVGTGVMKYVPEFGLGTKVEVPGFRFTSKADYRRYSKYYKYRLSL